MVIEKDRIKGEFNDSPDPLYEKQEVYKATLEYFDNDELQTNVWIDKYCLKDKQGQYMELTPHDMHRRLAQEFARIERKYENPLSYEKIYSLFRNFSMVIPAGSILYGVGNRYSISSLGNCFVIGDNSDSYGGICKTDQELCQLFKRRCGVGHDVSHLRPANATVTNAAGYATGPISYMHRYSHTARETAQSGRRGAQMITMDISHPDIEEFITCKDDISQLTGANISIKITDEFMKAVEDDKNYELLFFFDKEPDGQQKPPASKFIKAKPLWNKIIHQAWKSAEPGILFWDKIKSESIPSNYGKEWEETSTNPCGEIPLCPYDSCRLMSVNLYSFVDNPFTDKATFNYKKFKEVTYKAQRLMDDVIDLEEEKVNKILEKIDNDPEPEDVKSVERNLWLQIRSKLLAGRRTGLSCIGLADCLAACNIKYGSDSSIELAEEIYKQFAISAYKSSIDMAEERGAFPIWDRNLEEQHPFLDQIAGGLQENYPEYLQHNPIYWDGRRNISLLTIPPSGTISLLAGISSGIEPVYQLSYKRRRKLEKGNPNITFTDQNGDGWEEYTVLHPKFKEWAKIKWEEGNPEFLQTCLDSHDEEWIKNSTEDSPYYKSTAYEIDPISRVHLQASIQRWIDHSISSTINLPEDTTRERISDIYLEAWKSGCKGITIYRDNCRTGVLVSNDNDESKTFKTHDAPKRPKELDCEVFHTSVKGNKIAVVIGLLNEHPYEIFAISEGNDLLPTKGRGKLIKTGSGQYHITTEDESYFDIVIAMSDEEQIITRLASTALRHGTSVKFIVEQLNKTHGDLTTFGKGIGRILKKYIRNNEKSTEECQTCGAKLVYENGCLICKSCGWSKCG